MNAYEEVLLAIAVWREARGESSSAQAGVMWVILNRAACPSWWGKGVIDCILMPYQFSSFNAGDPNATKFPLSTDPVFPSILAMVRNPPADPTSGATSYFDSSLDDNPPQWSLHMTRTCNIGNLRFLK